VQLLGPVEAWGGTGVRSGLAPKQRGLLARLAVAAGHVVTTEQIVSGLWGEEPPDTGVKAVRFHVSRLRRALGDEATIRSVPGGYLLEGVETDVAEFDALVAAARAAAADGDERSAESAVSAALALWKGPALADVRSEPFAEAQARRLEEVRDAAAEDLVELRLARGEAASQVPELERLVAEAPLRERRWSLLVLALYRSGRQADALQAYQRLRRLLVEELGVEPSGPLRDLEQRVLSQDPSLDLRTSVEVPVGDPGPGANHGVGTGGLQAQPPIPGALRAARPLDAFVGRDDAVDELRIAWKHAVTSDGGVVFVNGPAGIGKTRLVAELAHEVHAAGAVVVLGRCEDGGDLPYAPWAEALRHAAEALPASAVATHVDAHGHVLANLVPQLRAPGTASAVAAEVDRLALFDAVVGLLRACAEVAPLLVVLEDVHWADPSSLQLLRHVARRVEDASMLLVVTTRSTDVDPGGPLASVVEALRRQPSTRTIELDGLAIADLVSVLEVQPAQRARARSLAAVAEAEATAMGMARIANRASQVLRQIDLTDVPTPSRPAPTVTRRSSTILVTDLVNSTALRVELGEEAADALRREHDALLSSVVAAHRGVVVKGLGDGILCTFSSAADALDAGIGLQRAVRSSAGDRALAIRVGISSGDVSLEEGDCFGTPVVEAARLCATAGPGNVLVAELTRSMARGRGGHRFGPLRELTLKGLPDGFEAVDLLVDAGSPHPPDPCASVGRPAEPLELPPLDGMFVTAPLPLVGRIEEQGELQRAWEDVRQGDRPVVAALVGESGAGKTRLASELARSIVEAGGIALQGRCDVDAGAPFAPWVELLAHLLANAPADLVTNELRRRLGPLACERTEDRGAMFDAAVDLLRSVATRAPTLVLIDDLQWADPSSTQLLRHVVRRLGPAGLLFVVTVRVEDLASPGAPTAVLLADLDRHVDVRRVTIGPLTPADVSPLVVDLGSPELAETVCEQAGGNAFLIQEIVLHAREVGLPASRLVLDVPSRVRLVVDGRVGRLPERARRDLVVAAVVGYEATVSTVAAASGRDALDVLDSLEVAAAHGLLVESGAERFRFGHALVRESLTTALSQSRRARLHLAVAEALAVGGGPAAEVAYHFGRCAGLEREDDARLWSMRAGDEAAIAHAWELAAEHHRRAADLASGRPELRAEALLSFAGSCNNAGDHLAGAEAALEAADIGRRLGRHDLLAQAALRYGGTTAYGANWLRPGDTTGPALFDDALAALPAEDTALRAQLLARRAGWMLFDVDPANRLRLSEEALDLARTVGDGSLLAEVLSERYTALRGQPDPAERWRVAEELVTVASQAGSEPQLAWGLVCLVGAQLNHGAVEAARESQLRLEALVDEHRFAYFRSRALGIRSILDLLAGATDEALRNGVAAIEATPESDGFRTVLRGQLAMVHFLQGDLAGFAAELWDDERGAPALGPVFGFQVHGPAVAGEADEALRLFVEWRERFASRVPASYVAVVLSGLGTVAPLCFDSDAAIWCYDRLRPYAGTWATSAEIAWAPVDHTLGVFAALAGDEASAAEHFRTAIAGCVRAGEVAWQGQARAALHALGAGRLHPRRTASIG
jgi:predicted ATPase/DNA-binding SARP family transcriptional activator/class 3 adenylate cyclase